VSFDRDWASSLDRMQREMERYLHHVAQKRPRPVVFSRRVWEPAIDVYETDDAVVALVDLPGVPQENIDLVVGRDSLTVRGERRDPDSEPRPERTYSVMEIPFGPFERTVRFSTAVNPDETKASYRAGFLEIVMPKLSVAGPHHVSVTQA
jgi:HSP20 family protein